MKLSPEDAASVVYDESNKWDKVETEIVDHSRWSISYCGIFKLLATGKFYRFYWSQGATEIQDECAYEYETNPIEVKEVFKKEVTKHEWVEVKD